MSTPVGIISGFLGAGKTTLLNQVLQGQHGRRVAVLVNDFGDINIDAQLITEITGETLSLANGCVCCTIRDDLVQAVQDLVSQDDPPEHILVETSGISEPAAAAMGIATAASLSRKAHVDAVVTVVDGANILSLTDDQRALAIEQIEAAHLLILNKIDLISDAEINEVEAKVRELAPGTRILKTKDCRVPMEVILGLSDENASGAPLTFHDHDHDHSHPFSVWSWTGKEPLHFEAIYKLFKNLPDTIWRGKGILYLKEVPERRVIFQMVGPRVSLNKAAPWNDDNPQSQIVLIGAAEGFDKMELTEQIESCARSDYAATANPLANAVIEFLRRS